MRRAAADPERISLFPFLAVLICTMGSLLVLLVVIAQRAQANARAEQRASQSDAEQLHRATQQDLEDLETEIGQLRSFRDTAADALSQRRGALAHIEDHMRRLADELRRLRETAKQLQETGQSRAADPDRLRAELRRVQRQLSEARQLLAATLESVGEQSLSYSILPYQGVNGTSRRPIYLECLAESVVIQPEGIVLSQHDFARPLGPDNPLAAALRAYSAYITSEHPDEHFAAVKPYPLLLVRPSGIAAYYAARAAMKSWDAEFGYELIQEEWDIDFPAADPRLARVVQQAVEIARPRHQFLVRHHRLNQRGQSARQTGNKAGQPGFGRLVDVGAGEAEPGTFGEGRPPTVEGGTGQSVRPPQTAATAAAGSRPQQQPSQQAPPGSLSFGTPSAENQTAQQDQSQSVADARGSDWALPNASNGSVPFTRPLRIECGHDQVVIVPRHGQATRKVIPFDGPTEDAVEKFVSAVWGHMRGWGIAGRGMYWKPVLNLYVRPGGEQRAQQLEALLDRSGLEIKRK